jgi:hypothetical protein
VTNAALGYCGSAAAAAAPALGRRIMEEWVGSDDPDVRWIAKSNLAKSRMTVLGREWVEAQNARLARRAPTGGR